MRWRVLRRRRGRLQVQTAEVHRAEVHSFDAGNSDGTGQRHIDGSSHDRLRLRRLPFHRSARPADAAFDHAQLQRASVLIDTTPDFREQALRENITQLDAVLYTHTHADHILGIDDLRPLTYHHKLGKLPLYATKANCEFLRNMFRYIFEANYKFGGLPQVDLIPIEGKVEVVWRAL